MIKQKSQHQNNVDDNLFFKKKIYNEKSGLGALASVFHQKR